MSPAARCHYAPLADMPIQDAAAAERWLSPDERREWQRIRSAERRATWLAGRMLAKRALVAELGSRAATDIHIESRSAATGHGERPGVFVDGRRLELALSIAHTSRGVLVALSCEPGVRLGVDLVCRGAAGARLNWTFSAAERRWLAEGNGRSAEQLWAMKEALYKACQQGEGFAPALIEVVPEIRYPGLEQAIDVRRLQSWRVDGQVAALVVVACSGEGATPHPACRPTLRVDARNHPLPQGVRVTLVA